MDIKFLQKSFLNLWEDCYGNQEIKFYIPTKEHSSGFYCVEMEQINEEEFDVFIEDGTYCELYTFEDIVKKFPEITLDKGFAFYNNFISWEDIDLAFRGKKEIDLIRL